MTTNTQPVSTKPKTKKLEEYKLAARSMFDQGIAVDKILEEVSKKYGVDPKKVKLSLAAYKATKK